MEMAGVLLNSVLNRSKKYLIVSNQQKQEPGHETKGSAGNSEICGRLWELPAPWDMQMSVVNVLQLCPVLMSTRLRKNDKHGRKRQHCQQLDLLCDAFRSEVFIGNKGLRVFERLPTFQGQTLTPGHVGSRP